MKQHWLQKFVHNKRGNFLYSDMSARVMLSSHCSIITEIHIVHHHDKHLIINDQPSEFVI
jgi:hypothetical protein